MSEAHEVEGEDIDVPEVSNKYNYIRFDVGSNLYLCHRDTLMKFPNSVLAKYVAPEFDQRDSELDFILIDRDGKHFGAILNFMRNPNSLDPTEWTRSTLAQLRCEADFYGLTELVEVCDAIVEEWNRPDYKVDPKRHLMVIYSAEEVEKYLKDKKQPTVLVPFDAWVAMSRQDSENILSHINHGKLSVVSYVHQPRARMFTPEGCHGQKPDFILFADNKFVESAHSSRRSGDSVAKEMLFFILKCYTLLNC